MAPARSRKRKFIQLTLEQSMCRSVAIVDRDTVTHTLFEINDSDTDEKPGPSRESRNPGPSVESSTRRVSADSSGSSGSDFSEPDPDSSDEWLPSGSTGKSRASSPDGAPGIHEGGCASSRAPTPVGKVKRQGMTGIKLADNQTISPSLQLLDHGGLLRSWIATCQLTSWSSS
ncbi:hypothetical protein N1851_017797 [Merluccius polli]|uniref:Uncharacterized protein n=1 Tax=Merluccius polli TaxID=89951 RepID=A0AA47MNY7_MERPO|nr:hypothetical protein N1851_017797 [Merluccius polli]